MILVEKKEWSNQDIIKILDPVINKWFFSKYKDFAPPQRYALIHVHNHENILITSPTGSGKTLAAFLSIINELLGRELDDKVYCVYISPLKALANDIKRNLEEPLKEIRSIMKKENIKRKGSNLRIGIRTGDTSISERQKQLRKPPHILVTTPESFALLLTSPKARNLLKDVEWVIVDEIHALAENKRGTHLSLSLERLELLKTGNPNSKGSFTRIGLSATISPLTEIAKFLVGYNEENPRDCRVIEVDYKKKMDLKVITPSRDLINIDPQDLHKRMYETLHQLIQDHRTTLIFTNTRGGTERVVNYLKEHFPKLYGVIGDDNGGMIGAHHGSMGKYKRFMIEEALKKGKLKAVVSSTSLELGIDIGYIDLVVLLGSPKSVSRAIQRIGRSGHELHEKSKGRIIVMDVDDLIECSVLLKNAREGTIDNIHIPSKPLDVLAQQIVGIIMNNTMSIRDLYQLIRNAYPYHSLKFSELKRVIDYLAGNYPGLEDKKVYAKIYYDPESEIIRKRGRLTRVIYMTNIGTIPDESFIKVNMDGKIIGKLDEQFFEKLKKGDVFVLGGEKYEFLYSRGMTAYVKPSINRPPTIPAWYSEMLPLSYELGLDIMRFRKLVKDYIKENKKNKNAKNDIVLFIEQYLKISKEAAKIIYDYLYKQYRYASISDIENLVIERFYDRNYYYTIFHSVIGRRANEVLARVAAFFAAKIVNEDIGIGVSDNGFYISSKKAININKLIDLILSCNLRDIAEKSLEKTEILSKRFRHVASRAFMILRSYKGNTKSVGKQQRISTILLKAVKNIDKDFPLLKEAKREVLEDAMDIKNAEDFIERIIKGKTNIERIYTEEVPSPFALGLLSQGYSDLYRQADRQEFIRKMYELITAKVLLEDAREERKNKEE